MKKIFLTLFLFSFLVLNIQAADYYVTATGNDASAGTTKATAWLTIKKANLTVTAGDIVHVYKGVYADSISPKANGTASKRIKYIAEEDSVVLYSSLGSSSARNIYIVGTAGEWRRYITIDGFIFAGYTYSTWLEYCRDIIIRNCIFRVWYTAQNLDAGIVTQSTTSNITIEGCIVSFRGNASTQGRFVYVAGDTFYIRHNTFIRSNTTYSGMSIQSTASYVDISDNIFLSTSTNANYAVACNASAVATTTTGINYYYNFASFSDNLTDTTQVVKADPVLWESTYSNLPLYTSDYHTDFNLKSTSPCIAKSDDGLDIGAVPSVIMYLRNE